MVSCVAEVTEKSEFSCPAEVLSFFAGVCADFCLSEVAFDLLGDFFGREKVGEVFFENFSDSFLFDAGFGVDGTLGDEFSCDIDEFFVGFVVEPSSGICSDGVPSAIAETEDQAVHDLVISLDPILRRTHSGLHLGQEKNQQAVPQLDQRPRIQFLRCRLRHHNRCRVILRHRQPIPSHTFQLKRLLLPIPRYLRMFPRQLGRIPHAQVYPFIHRIQR